MSVYAVSSLKSRLAKPLLISAVFAVLSLFSNAILTQELPAQPLSFEIAQTVEHSEQYFTQGLFFHEGSLYESTGHYGQSQLIRYQADMKTVLMARRVPSKYFAEGATQHKGTIYQLTWRAEIALAYKPERLSRAEGFQYEGQGWGLTSDGKCLWMSNGSDQLKKMNEDGSVTETISVSFNGRPLDKLNELEWVNGKIFANRWFDNRIYVIDPISGNVEHFIDLNDLAKPERAGKNENVLNGIAWNPETESLWITGKYWPSLYELKITPYQE